MDESRPFTPAKQNMLSANQNPDYLSKETKAGNILGPFSPALAPKAHTNRFGVSSGDPSTCSNSHKTWTLVPEKSDHVAQWHKATAPSYSP